MFRSLSPTGFVVLLCTALCAPAARPAPIAPVALSARWIGPQEIGPRLGGVGPLAPVDPEYLTLAKSYNDALNEYHQKRLDLSRGGKTPPPMEHPARAFAPRFRPLGEKGIGPALVWLFQNVPLYIDDKPEAVSRAKELFARIVPRLASDDSMLWVLTGIRDQAAALGAATAIDMCKQMAESSLNPEVKSRAIFIEADLIAPPGKTTDPALIAEGRELYRSIVADFPRTAAAIEAASTLIVGVQREFDEAELSWVKAVESLQAAGRPSTDWPRQPVHQLQPQFLALSKAGSPKAVKWINNFYPGFVEAERLGLGPALNWLAGGMGARYPIPTTPLHVARLAILRIIYREFPADKWIPASLEALRQESYAMTPAEIEPVVGGLIEKSPSAQIRALARMCLALANTSRGDQAGYEATIQLYQKVMQDVPGEFLAEEARRGRDKLIQVMPGAVAPNFFVKDTEDKEFQLADYRGRVVMLDFYNLLRNGMTDAGARRDLVKKMLDRPFSLVGINNDLVDKTTFYTKALEMGVSWRSGMLNAAADKLHDTYEVRKFPSTILIDAQGIIRARDLAWGEMVRLAEKLVAETEKVTPKK